MWFKNITVFRLPADFVWRDLLFVFDAFGETTGILPRAGCLGKFEIQRRVK